MCVKGDSCPFYVPKALIGMTHPLYEPLLLYELIKSVFFRCNTWCNWSELCRAWLPVSVSCSSCSLLTKLFITAITHYVSQQLFSYMTANYLEGNCCYMLKTGIMCSVQCRVIHKQHRSWYVMPVPLGHESKCWVLLYSNSVVNNTSRLKRKNKTKKATQLFHYNLTSILLLW